MAEADLSQSGGSGSAGGTATAWDREVDFLVAGSGAAGLSAAITATLNGLDVLVVESEEKWGGTTCISGGGLWVPNNPVMKKAGIQDSIEEALAYMDAIIPDLGPWTSRERKLAFLTAIPTYVNMLSDQGIVWSRSKDYPDYYPDLPGSKTGRAIELRSFNMRKLRGYQKKSRMDQGIPAPLRNDDVWLLGRAWSSPHGFLRGAQFIFRTLRHLVAGDQERGMGPALAGSLMYIVRRHGVPVWLRSPITEVIVEDGRAVGAIVTNRGRQLRIRARRGVMLAAGGFARNTEWREKYQGIPGWSAAPDGQLGTGIKVGMDIGGDIAMMEDAWWGAGVKMASGANSFVLGERSFPYSMVVDQSGERYLDESESYVDFGHHMLERDKVSPAIHSWLVTDARHTRRYLNTFTLMGKKELIEQGEIVVADTLAELASKTGMDRATLLATVARFNGFAKEGVDRDFQRGRTSYDRYYGDPGVKPNPNLGALEKGPFHAFKLYPGDLGTKGGLVTDEHARVLREDGSSIDGLYAAGNNTASVMGHTYPGPGSSISPAGIFGYLGALHAAQQAQNPQAPGRQGRKVAEQVRSAIG
ncbi:FAD-binding protein [Naasia lichenicola]|uniref:FAD-binding protein n=1 Tax=Naasia lichenicola TaxID=2565933 RepID=UPI001E4854DC|nr:FAD-binding protein [Naasia lichenicola]